MSDYSSKESEADTKSCKPLYYAMYAVYYATSTLLVSKESFTN